jgi:hypothetical protein
MPTVKLVLLLLFTIAATQISFAASELAHPQIDMGASFLFSQTFEDHSGKHGPYSPRLDAWQRNGKGGLIFTGAIGPKTESTKNTILQTMFALDAGACVVDVFNGFALVTGKGCGVPLPKDRTWSATDRSNDTYQCRVTEPRMEHVSVPAGEFDAVKIECRRVVTAGSTQQLANYWYVPRLGAMVKTIYRNFNAAHEQISVNTTELVNYEAPPQKGSD